MTSPQQPPDPAGAIETAQTLAAALDGMADELKAVNANSEKRDAGLKSYGRWNRAGLVLDVLLTVVIALLAWQASGTASRVSAADARAAAATAAETAEHTALVTGCQAGNQERAGELALWTYLFHASTPGTPAQQKAVALFMQQVDRTFSPRDCAKAYALTPAKGAQADGSR